MTLDVRGTRQGCGLLGKGGSWPLNHDPLVSTHHYARERMRLLEVESSEGNGDGGFRWCGRAANRVGVGIDERAGASVGALVLLTFVVEWE